MVKTYSEYSTGRTKIFIAIDDDKVVSITSGNNAITVRQGVQFFVDDYVAEQIHKCELMLDGLTPKLVLKEGETLEVPTEEDEKEKEIKELEERLQKLKAE